MSEQDDAGLEALEVDCPKCGETAGDPCVTPKGRPTARYHAARAKAAAAPRGEAPLEGDELVPDRIVGRRWRELFLACRRDLESRDDWSTLARELLEALVLDLAEAANALRVAAGEPVVVGSAGQPAVNPMYANARGLQAQALATAKALRLTPEVRPSAGGDAAPGDPLAELDRRAEADELARKRRARGA